MDAFISNYEEYVVLPYSDFQKLKSIAEMRQKDCVTMISHEDLLFLSALADHYWKECTISLEILKNTVTFRVSNYQEEIINSSFSLDICKKYYNNVNKFIEEVL